MALQDVTPQLRTRLRKVEWMVVLFLIGAILLVIGAVGWWVKKTGDARGWFVLETPYYTFLESGAGVKAGTPIKMLGFTIGQVAKVEAQEDSDWARQNHYNVMVHFLIREPYFGWIHTDSRMRMAGTGVDLLGGSWLEITRAEGRGIPTTAVSNGVPQVLNDKYAFDQNPTNKVYHPFRRRDFGFFLGTERTESLVDNAASILETLRIGLPQITNQIGAALTDLNKALAEVRTLVTNKGGVGDLVFPTNLNASLDRTLADVHELRERIDPVLTNSQALLQDVRENSRRMGPLLDDVRGTVTNLEQVVIAMKSQVESTNLVGNVSRLADKAALLADTTDTLLRRHWLFRSAFKTNKVDKPKTAPAK
jgi:MlaD protein